MSWRKLFELRFRPTSDLLMVSMPWSEIGFLFLIGLLYAATFQLTKNIFIPWPLMQPMGQLTTLLNDGLPLPPLATLGFAEALAMMIAIVIVVPRLRRRRTMRGGTLKSV